MPYGTIAAETIQSGTAGQPPQFKDSNGVEQGELCRAWVNFNGTGTVAIRAAFNVSSITDNGVGDYTVNFTNALQDANYCGQTTTSLYAYGCSAEYLFSATTSAARVQTYTQVGGGNGALVDAGAVHVSVFR